LVQTGAQFQRMMDSIQLRAGQKVGNDRFLLVQQLGRGGMGEVWLARDVRLNEPVALKFLPAEIRSNPVALDYLRTETARSHKLTHPHIVRIHDLHEEESGMAFVAMEYVDGPTLEAMRLQQPNRVVGWEQLQPLVQQLCTALGYAHEEKVVHRDLKPANLMVDARGRLKLADFGVAAVVSDSMSRASQGHSTSGTLVYMSPQQLAGKRPQVGDDIYALGATLYELLTSQPPFYTGDITHQVLNVAPEPVEERLGALAIINPVPPHVVALIMACLAKEPGQRPQSAPAVVDWINAGAATPRAELPAELERGAADSAAGPKPPTAEILSPPAEAEPAWAAEARRMDAALRRSRRAWLWAGGGVAALILAGGIWWGLHWHRPWTNTLGMAFLPVPGTEVQFSIWDTRVQDFAAFVQASEARPNGGAGSVLTSNGWLLATGAAWAHTGFVQQPTHPVCGVSWEDAQAFCAWLTEKERREGTLATNQVYRLPTDEEWSRAADENGRTPAEKDSLVYSWGTSWPPPAGAGNFAGEEARSHDWPADCQVIPGYRDRFERTSPVGSFRANAHGLFDMSGNVWQWCQDQSRAEQTGSELTRVLRGGSWLDFSPGWLAASCRYALPPTARFSHVGFRVVLAQTGP